jgi:hypothetical protein
MGSNPVLPPPQPSTPPPTPPFSDAEAHYTNLLAYFQHLVWLTGGALGVVVLVGGYLFHSNLQDNLRDASENAKREATRVATEESQKAVKTAFDEKNVNALIEQVAKEKVSAVTDKMVEGKVGPIADRIIEQRLTSRLQPIELRMLLLARVSESAARMRLGLRPGLDELLNLVNGTQDPDVARSARSTLALVTADYETVFQRNTQGSPTRKAADLLANFRFGVQPKTLHEVVEIISDDADLNYVALAFLTFNDLTGEKTKMFDFAAVKKWCANNEPKCK